MNCPECNGDMERIEEYRCPDCCARFERHDRSGDWISVEDIGFLAFVVDRAVKHQINIISTLENQEIFMGADVLKQENFYLKKLLEMKRKLPLPEPPESENENEDGYTEVIHPLGGGRTMKIMGLKSEE